MNVKSQDLTRQQSKGCLRKVLNNFMTSAYKYFLDPYVVMWYRTCCDTWYQDGDHDSHDSHHPCNTVTQWQGAGIPWEVNQRTWRRSGWKQIWWRLDHEHTWGGMSGCPQQSVREHLLLFTSKLYLGRGFLREESRLDKTIKMFFHPKIKHCWLFRWQL